MDPRCSRMFKCRIQVIAVAYGTKAPFTLIQLGKRITRENFSLFISSSRCGTCISYGMLSRFVTFLVNYPTNLVLARYFSLLFLAECNFNFIILIIVFFFSSSPGLFYFVSFSVLSSPLFHVVILFSQVQQRRNYS